MDVSTVDTTRVASLFTQSSASNKKLVEYIDWSEAKELIQEEDPCNRLATLSKSDNGQLEDRVVWGAHRILAEGIGQYTYSDVKLIISFHDRMARWIKREFSDYPQQDHLETIHKIALDVLCYLPASIEAKKQGIENVILNVDMLTNDAIEREKSLSFWNNDPKWLKEIGLELNEIVGRSPITLPLKTLRTALVNDFSLKDQFTVISKIYQWMMEDDRCPAKERANEILGLCSSAKKDDIRNYLGHVMKELGGHWDTTENKKDAIKARIDRLFEGLETPEKRAWLTTNLEEFLKKLEEQVQ